MRSYSTLVRHPGNQTLFEAVELSLVAALAGWPLHLHAEGLRGTGKTTIIRSAREIIPKITRIQGCSYNCDPARPHCPQHRGLTGEQVRALGTEEIPMPFLEISHSAKVGTVAGSIDLARLTDRSGPETALLPGVLARAHRGIVFIDEINRLADTSPEITDLLLDAMGTRPGRLQIEETGLPTVELPVQVTVWAASNPDEDPGALEDVRRQLADRFDLNVSMGRVSSRDVLLEILGEADPEGRASVPLAAPHAGAEASAAPGLQGGKGRTRCRFASVLKARASAAASVAFPAAVRRAIADLYLECGLESLRTVEAVQLAARVACARGGREEVSLDDLRRIVPLVAGRRADPEAIQRFLARAAQVEPRPAAGSWAAHPADPAGRGPGGGALALTQAQGPTGAGREAQPEGRAQAQGQTHAQAHGRPYPEAQGGEGLRSDGGQTRDAARYQPWAAGDVVDCSPAAHGPEAAGRSQGGRIPEMPAGGANQHRGRRPGFLSRLFSPFLPGDGLTSPSWPVPGQSAANWPSGAPPSGDQPPWPVQAPPERARQLQQLSPQDLVRVPDGGGPRAGR